ncbi:MAG: hypothetical protein Q8Q85_02210 [Gemmatimonadales bacterium]|nr:hypothetical protein [Gemmatimonadales bacterium]
MKRYVSRLLAGAALSMSAVLAACADSTSAATPGVVTASLATPSSDDGAVAVTITGPGVSTVQAVNSAYRLYFRLASDGEMRVIVVGNLVAGPVFSVGVADVGNLGDYVVTVNDVVTRADSARASLAGYGVTLTAAGR